MYLKKHLLLLALSIFLSTAGFSQLVQVTPANAVDTACHGDTSFIQVFFTNTDNAVTVTIDSIVAPSGFGRKGTYPINISNSTTAPNNFATVDFYHEGSTLGTYTDTFLVYSNVANRPRPFKVGVSMTFVPRPVVSYTVNDTSQCSNSNSFVFSNTSTISSGSMTYNWFFGDAGSDTATSPTYSYTDADTFDVLMIATSNLGCEDVSIRKMVVFPTPVTKIYNPNTFVCFKNNSINFNDSTKISSGTYSVKWFFGNGDSSTASHPSYSYAQDSSFYRVKLRATSDQGCVKLDSQDVYVYPTPVPNFTVNDSDQCINTNSFTFTNTSTLKSGTIDYSWDFGDATTSTVQNPVKTYAATGSRTIRLICTSDLGCPDTLEKYIMVHRKPTVNFSITDSAQCFRGNIFGFNNSSTINVDTLFYLWDFGDGNTDTTTSISHIYANTGTYPVKLLATSNNGCKDSLTKNTFVYTHPVTSYNLNDSAQCLNNHNFVFSNTSTISSGIISSYSWNFGNGDTSSTFSPSKNNFVFPDTLTVRLIAKSDQGCNDTLNKEIIVFPVPQVAYGISDTVQCFKNHQFQFDDNSTIDYGTLSHLWDFGNGVTSQQGDTVYSYPTYGQIFSISLTVTSDQGCSANKTDSLYLYQSPVADFLLVDSAQCLSGNQFNFISNSSTPAGTITHHWKFGTNDTSNQINPDYTYAFSDTFMVKLTVTTNLGCQDSMKKQTVVFPQPVAKFVVNKADQCLAGNQFDFRDTSTIQYGTLTYNWDFGDATSSALKYPSKVYAAFGVYDVLYTVTSDLGCDSTVTASVEVYAQPTAGFTINDSTQCINGNLFNYSNTSTLGAGTMFYSWDLGNGATSVTKDPAMIYTFPDTLTVKMIVTSDKNCKDSVSKNVYIFPKPVVNYTVNDPTQCFEGNNYIFTNTSLISWGTLTYEWDFNDGAQSVNTNETHVFGAANVYGVKLKSTSALGCSDSVIKSMTVHPSPVAGFTINDSSQCINGNSFAFTNSSVISSGSMNYQWSFGDVIGGSIAASPTYAYNKPDTFTVQLVAGSVAGNCYDTITKTVYVTPSPKATFTGLDDQLCVNGPAVTLIPTFPGGTFSGDNILGNEFTPALQGWNRVQYAVTLNGCSDTLRDSTLVVPVPLLNLGDDTVMCAEDFYSLNVTTLGATYLWSDSTTRSFNRITTPGRHWVRVTNACGIFTEDVKVAYLDFPCDAFIPNAFTPEGNTVNDYFVPHIDTSIVKSITFIIVNRWGDVIFETRDLATRGWDGNVNGLAAPEGVYGYLLKMSILREDVRVLKTLKGNFHLLR